VPRNGESATDFFPRKSNQRHRVLQAKHEPVGEGVDSPPPPQLAKRYVVCALGLSCHETPIKTHERNKIGIWKFCFFTVGSYTLITYNY
jgi:hypothetical protein